MSNHSLTCYGGVGSVTGANFLLEADSEKFLIDCGLLQGVSKSAEERANNEHFDYDVTNIKALFITHAHVDHIGRIPKLIMAGFKGVIYSTPATKIISEVMLQDLVHIENLDADLVVRAMSLWQSLDYHEIKDMGPFKAEIYNSGHILGSGMFKFIFPSGKSIVFTGDLGNSPSPLLKDLESVGETDYILMESVYGDRNHESHEERDEHFREVVKRISEEKSTLVVPVFSLERTQVILHALQNMYEKKEIQNVPVFLDSPLAIRITDIYQRLIDKDFFDFPMLRETAEARDSQEIYKTPGPKIILAGSGMSTAGRILFHEERFLPDEKATILFIGFQAPGTLGRQIQEGLKEVIIHDKQIPVRAKVETILGFSAHAGSDQLVDFVAGSQKSLKKVFVAMGELKASIFLAQRIHDELGVEAIVPKRGEKYILDL